MEGCTSIHGMGNNIGLYKKHIIIAKQMKNNLSICVDI